MSTVKFMMGLITPTVISGGIKKTVKVHRISPAHTSRVFTKLYFTFCRLYYRSAEFILHGQLNASRLSFYSTVTDLARFLGLSISQPRISAT
jgi:hypothetical protein